jgi:hypothetical protein
MWTPVKEESIKKDVEYCGDITSVAFRIPLVL